MRTLPATIRSILCVLLASTEPCLWQVSHASTIMVLADGKKTIAYCFVPLKVFRSIYTCKLLRECNEIILRPDSLDLVLSSAALSCSRFERLDGGQHYIPCLHRHNPSSRNKKILDSWPWDVHNADTLQTPDHHQDHASDVLTDPWAAKLSTEGLSSSSDWHAQQISFHSAASPSFAGTG